MVCRRRGAVTRDCEWRGFFNGGLEGADSDMAPGVLASSSSSRLRDGMMVTLTRLRSGQLSSMNDVQLRVVAGWRDGLVGAASVDVGAGCSGCATGGKLIGKWGGVRGGRIAHGESGGLDRIRGVRSRRGVGSWGEWGRGGSMSMKSSIPLSSQKRSGSKSERGGTGNGARSIEPRRQTSSQGKSDMVV